jgi:hypothetical protein
MRALKYYLKNFYMKLILLLVLGAFILSVIIHLVFMYFANKKRIKFVNKEIKDLIKSIINKVSE